MSGGLPPTPAAAAVAAAATGGMLSPRATLDRRSSAFLDAPGTANRAAGSGWGQWAPSGAAGEAGWSGGGGGAAAAAGGTAADKRGAGLGQELITPLQVDPSIDFDQVRWFVYSGCGGLLMPGGVLRGTCTAGVGRKKCWSVVVGYAALTFACACLA
jgi:hypothetical protein